MRRLVALILCAVLGAPALGVDAAPELKAGVFTPARVAPDFRLPGSTGHDVALSQYRGKVVLLSFGYTSCTEVCPITLAVLAQARRQLGPAGADLQVVYVTVDPERDTAERMRRYLANFDPTFVGATGTPAELAAVRKDYGISATRLPVPGGYAYAHSSYVYLIDRAGRLSALMPFGHASDDYVHDVKLLLKK